MSLRLKEIREAKGLSIEALSSLSGVGKGTISIAERNGSEPGYKTLCKLARALGVGIEELIVCDDGYVK